MVDVKELLAKVEAAQGPDRELDAAIMLTLFHPEYEYPSPVLNRRPGSYHEAYERMHLMGAGDVGARPPQLTASIDAALALVERVLPETDFLINSRGNYACIWDSKESGRDGHWEAHGRTLPLAIIAALLRSRAPTIPEEG